MLYLQETCQFHIISCRQFTSGDDAIRAIETRVSLDRRP